MSTTFDLTYGRWRLVKPPPSAMTKSTFGKIDLLDLGHVDVLMSTDIGRCQRAASQLATLR
jgi:hypothetical protein